jgi:pyridoxal phosphate enzyme (YggS family)
MESATARVEYLLARMDRAAQRSGRRLSEVTLVAVTKTIPLETIQPYLSAGIRHVGENRVQEALEKYSAHSSRLTARPTFHLIGPLQSNKAKKAIEFFDMIQSLDRWELAVNLDRLAGARGKTLDCLVQVKISDEPSKFGLDPAHLSDFHSQVAALPHIRIRGLMGIPPLAAQGDAARPYFSRLRKLFEEVSSHVPRSTFNILSMGMSSDFEIAIEEGSTMVRIGTALFGARPAILSSD